MGWFYTNVDIIREFGHFLLFGSDTDLNDNIVPNNSASFIPVSITISTNQGFLWDLQIKFMNPMYMIFITKLCFPYFHGYFK